MVRTRSPRRNTVGAGELLQKQLDVDDLSESLHSNGGGEEGPYFVTESAPLAVSTEAEGLRRTLTPPKSTYNRQLTPTKSAIRNPRVKKTNRRKGLRKTVSFSNRTMEIPPEEHPEDDEEEETAKAEESEQPSETSEDGEEIKTESPSSSGDAGPGLRRTMSASAAVTTSGPGLRRTVSTGSARTLENSEGDGAPIKRVTRPRMTPEERQAKREQALKEAKAAAKNVRKQNRSSITENSAIAKQVKSTKGLFKNPFRRSKSLDSATAKQVMSEGLDEKKGKAEAEEKKAKEAPKPRPKPVKAQSAAVLVKKEQEAAPAATARPKPVKSQSAAMVVEKKKPLVSPVRSSRSKRVSAAAAAAAATSAPPLAAAPAPAPAPAPAVAVPVPTPRLDPTSVEC